MGEHRDRYQRALDLFPNKKMARFVEAYSGNSAEAARIAGYAKKSAAQQGSRLLDRQDVKHALELRALAEAEDQGLSPSPSPPPPPQAAPPENLPARKKAKSAGKPDSIEPKGHRVNNAVNLNSAAVNSGKSTSKHAGKRAVKGGKQRADDESPPVEPFPELSREALVRRAKLTRNELLGWLTGVILGEVVIPKVSMFGVPYMSGASMSERLKASEQLAKIQGWQVTTTAQLNNLEELERFKESEARKARLEDLRAESRRKRERLEELEEMRDQYLTREEE